VAAVRLQHLGQRLFLLVGGIQAIFEGFAHSGPFLLRHPAHMSCQPCGKWL
jgi:hypothetical protein